MRRVIFALLLLTITTQLLAQTPCAGDMSITTCTDEIVKSTLKETAKKEEQADVTNMPTGVPAIDSLTGNSLRDFLAVFSAAVQSANLSEENDAITLDWNLRLDETGDDPIKLQAVFRKPTLWEPFAKSVSDATKRAALLENLDDLDDVTFSVSYSPEGATRGRLLEFHREVFESIAAAVPARVSPEVEDELLQLFQELSRDNVVPFDTATDPGAVKFSQITDPARREQVRAKVIAAAEAIRDSRAEFDRRFNAAGLNRFSDLLNNQPQIYFSFNVRERDALVGPGERTLKASYERGFVNLNTFRKHAGSKCPGSQCADTFKTYVTTNRAALDSSNRIAFSLDYAEVEKYDIRAEGVDPFSVKGSRKTSGSFVYGRMLRHGNASRDGRLDVSLTYEDVKSDDPLLDNRWIGSAIYTQKLSDTVSLPIGFVYASRENDLPANDRKLSAHFGLVFKLPKLVP